MNNLNMSKIREDYVIDRLADCVKSLQVATRTFNQSLSQVLEMIEHMNNIIADAQHQSGNDPSHIGEEIECEEENPIAAPARTQEPVREYVEPPPSLTMPDFEWKPLTYFPEESEFRYRLIETVIWQHPDGLTSREIYEFAHEAYPGKYTAKRIQQTLYRMKQAGYVRLVMDEDQGNRYYWIRQPGENVDSEEEESEFES